MELLRMLESTVGLHHLSFCVSSLSICLLFQPFSFREQQLLYALNVLYLSKGVDLCGLSLYLFSVMHNLKFQNERLLVSSSLHIPKCIVVGNLQSDLKSNAREVEIDKIDPH